MYGAVAGVRGLSFKVDEGEIFGFLGPNGAGKTTTIRLLMNFVRLNEGEVKIFGRRLCWGDYDYLKDIGYLPDELILPGNITGSEILNFWNNLKGKSCIWREKSLDALSFPMTDLQRKFKEYSRGMKQKLFLVGAIQTLPRLLILDEPTEGLDPLVKHALLSLLREMKGEGCAIFFSSHILSEVEQVADTAGIIRQGHLVASAAIEDLKQHSRKKVSITFKNAFDLEKFISNFPQRYIREELTLNFALEQDLNELFKAISDFEVSDLSVSKPTLEDIFLEYYENPLQ
jgi:ABC-2 type transport system ATP-binding protein